MRSDSSQGFLTRSISQAGTLIKQSQLKNTAVVLI